ncbi:MAG: DMT family transporter [Acidobacteriota bacterium]
MLLLAAIWGASFLFLRMAAPVVGPVAVAAFRVALATLVLLPFALRHLPWQTVKRLWPALLVSGLLSCALPFMGLSQAARAMPAGLLSILNATSPLWGALVGWLWAGERLSRWRAVGLALGFGGVAWLSITHTPLDGQAPWLAIGLALSSTLMYALAVHHSKRYLSSLPPLVVTTGCLLAASLVLTGPALWLGPQPAMPLSPTSHLTTWSAVPGSVWAALVGLAVLCTAWAYLLFFKLIAEIGPSRALTVTFLIPIFGMLWGWLFLQETVTADMLVCTAIIVAGTQLSNRAR